MASEVVRNAPFKYTDGKGWDDLEAVWADKYLVFTTWPCSECDAREPAGKTIYNMFDKQEVFKKDIGNLKFNLDTDTFTYQKLSSFTEKCNDSNALCDNGTWTTMKPSGQTYTETLP